jgi:hypothetical protein
MKKSFVFLAALGLSACSAQIFNRPDEAESSVRDFDREVAAVRAGVERGAIIQCYPCYDSLGRRQADSYARPKTHGPTP